MKQLPLALILLCALAAQASADETFDLRLKYHKGQVLRVTQSVSKKLSGSQEYGPQAVPLEIEEQRTTAFSETIESSKDGRRQKVTRKYTKSHMRVVQNGEKRQADTPLAGKTVTFEIDGEQIKILAPANLPDSAKALLQPEDWNEMMPAKPVAIGHKWQVTGEALRRVLVQRKTEWKSGKMQCRLLEIKDGRAQIDVTASFKLFSKAQKIHTSTTLAGRIVVDLTRHLVTAQTLAGTTRMTAKLKQNGMQLLIDVKGPTRMTLKVQ